MNPVEVTDDVPKHADKVARSPDKNDELAGSEDVNDEDLSVNHCLVHVHILLNVWILVKGLNVIFKALLEKQFYLLFELRGVQKIKTFFQSQDFDRVEKSRSLNMRFKYFVERDYGQAVEGTPPFEIVHGYLVVVSNHGSCLLVLILQEELEQSIAYEN